MHVLHTNKTQYSKCAYLKLNQFSKLNFLSRTKFIGEFDSDSVLPYLLHLTKVCEYRLLKPYHKMPVNHLDIFYSKWIEPNNSFPFHEFEFECDSNVPDKIKNILKPNNDEIAIQNEKIPMLDGILENLTTDAELEVIKYNFRVTERENLVQDSYFIYDHSNLVKKSLITEPNQFISIYESVSYFDEKKN